MGPTPWTNRFRRSIALSAFSESALGVDVFFFLDFVMRYYYTQQKKRVSVMLESEKQLPVAHIGKCPKLTKRLR